MSRLAQVADPAAVTTVHPGEGVRATELLQHSISLHALRCSYLGREGEDKGKRWSVEAPRPVWALEG